MSLIVILGPTAVGKTRLAVEMASVLNGEIISADSRQVYLGMDIGTGKDLQDFVVNGKTVHHHLIDIKEAGEEYHVFDFQKDFYEAYQCIEDLGKQAILCGGTGLYLEAALADEKMIEVPRNEPLRQKLIHNSQVELNNKLGELKPDLHNSTDLTDRERTLRAIEIELFKQVSDGIQQKSPVKEKLVFGIRMEREQLRARIEERLKSRLDEGMIEEVEQLMQSGISRKKLDYYGLEYRYIAAYLEKELSYDAFYTQLLQGIRRFAKKQMTWYRRMEKRGVKIHWIDANLPLNKKIEFVVTTLKNQTNFE